jgi:hypothetical protein
MLLSKALRMQQDLEDKKHEVIIEGLESKLKDQAADLKKKDFELQTTEGLLAEGEVKIAKLNSELLSKSESFEQEKQKLNTKFKTEVEKSLNLQKSLTVWRNRPNYSSLSAQVAPLRAATHLNRNNPSVPRI